MAGPGLNGVWWPLVIANTVDESRAVEKLLLEALRLSPDYAYAHALIALLYGHVFRLDWLSREIPFDATSGVMPCCAPAILHASRSRNAHLEFSRAAGRSDMVMGARPDVRTASPAMTVFALTGLLVQLVNALASVPFRRPAKGRESPLHNLGITVTRTVMRAFIGYAGSLPTAEFRSVESLLERLCRIVLPPFLRGIRAEMQETSVGGIGGLRYRPRAGESRGTILYLHGGGYIGTSPAMYTIFTGRIAAETGCSVFVPDYRLAPEFPFPASLVDAVAVYEGLLDAGVRPTQLFVAGDSGGGGLVNAMMVDPRVRTSPRPAGLILFSPEVSLTLDEPSITENAGRDILPWNIPVWPYLHGRNPRDPAVSPIDADLHDFPPAFVAFGGDEMFRDAIRRFVARLQASGVDTTAIEEPDMFHAFPLLMPWADASERVYRAVGEFVRKRLARESA